MKNRPSSHFFLLLLLLGLNTLAYVAIFRAGVGRGFSPSLLLAARDLLLFLPIFFIFFWVVRRHRYAGDFTLLTVAVLLFGIGQFMQYRLFTDPEYSAGRRDEARQARLAKANTLQQRYINQYYDADKKRALFNDPNYQIPLRAENPAAAREEQYWTVRRILTSISSAIPLLAFLGLMVAFAATKRDDILLWMQRHSFLIGLATTVPFIVIAIVYSSGGKFLGNTTPWEPVKIAFLISYAGILADHYRNLSRTWWGIPPWRFVLPFLLVALMPIVPFFALSDFGQMLVFLGAYLTLYLVAVRRVPQVTMAIVLVGVLLFASIFAAGIYNTVVDIFSNREQVSAVERVKGLVSQGIPRRIHQRFYLWRHGGIPPDPDDHWWWAAEAVDEGRGFSNEEMWYNKYAYQPSQALFGISDGRMLGKGLGKGYPESVPIADSDFIYAALAEEMGLLGGAILLAGFLLLMIAGMRTAIQARDMFTKLIAAGITAFLGFQAIVNVGGVIRMLPMTGITLPFVSHGGWSLITSFWMLGMLMAISHRNHAVKL